MINQRDDVKYIQRCLDLARLGLGKTKSNPLVGSVIVHNGKIIGEGYHHKYGGNHAEVNAINSVKDKTLLKDSVIYVNLEPCSHHGKTPPCADLIVSMKIPQVVIGSLDTSAKVSGRGVEKLESGSCKVRIGVLEEECRELNKRFFTFHEKKRPYIILKWAQTKDGFIDKKRNKDNKQPAWITNEYAKTMVHKWRADEEGIMIGRNTAILDNPSLTVRNWKGTNPIWLVVNYKGSLSRSLNIFNTDSETIVLRESSYEIGGDVIDYDSEVLDNDFFGKLFDVLTSKKIISIIIEGGRNLLESFINKNYWDEARIFIGNKKFEEGVKAPEFNLEDDFSCSIEDSLMKYYRNMI